jgi:fatty-acyl-CoA synthase
VVGVARPKNQMRDWDAARSQSVRRQAALPLAGVETRLRDDAGAEVPWDGTSMGAVELRGPWIAGGYLGEDDDSGKFTEDGWFATGDIAIGSPEGYIVIADRTKDLVKSGGEWISSVDMENAIAGMDGVSAAAVVAVPDPKWDERPLPCVVGSVSIDDVRAHLEAAGFPRWQLPERLELIDALPLTSVGKVDKRALRERYAGTSAP